MKSERLHLTILIGHFRDELLFLVLYSASTRTKLLRKELVFAICIMMATVKLEEMSMRGGV